jgi:hypothetical protein
VAWDDGSEIRTFRQYEQALSGSGFRELLGPNDEQAELDEERARRLIGRTWELSLDLLERQGASRARPLLRLVCCFERAPLAYQEILSPDLLKKTVLLRDITPRELARTIDALAGLDLITISNDSGKPELSLHPLVRNVGRQYVLQQKPSLFQEYLNVVTSLLAHALRNMAADGDPAEWAGWEALAPHCLSGLRLAEDKDKPLLARPSWKPEELLIPAQLATRFLHRAGRYQELEETIATWLRWRLALSGPPDIPTLTAEADLAFLRQSRGDHASAAKLYRHLVLAAIQGERRWRGCVVAGERGFRGGSGCGGVRATTP